jgi:hypothetical protein
MHQWNEQRGEARRFREGRARTTRKGAAAA